MSHNNIENACTRYRTSQSKENITCTYKVQDGEHLVTLVKLSYLLNQRKVQD